MYGRFHKAMSYLPYAFILSTCKKGMNRDSEMDQLVNVLAAKRGDLSSIPGTHRVEGKNQLPQVIL